MTTDFRALDLDATLGSLPPEQRPLWGKMSARHMVEHLVLTTRMSNGKIRVAVETPADKVERVKALFILGDRPFPQGARAQVLPEEPAPFIFSSMQEAIDVLKTEINYFENYFSSNPGTIENHPVFGPMAYSEWILYHNKHFLHHYKQFGIV